MLDKHFDPKSIEKQHYEEWEASGAFAANPESPKAPFTIMMPPPNVTGSLHMGHALTMTLQDILTRYSRMRGHDALWMPGTDHAGIATQMVVERQIESEGGSRKAMGREAFLERVWQWKAESGGTITHQLRKLGTTPDWQRESFTMDEKLSKAVLKSFVQLYKEGLIYRDKRLVNWDPKLQTAVSDIEVESRDVRGHMWHIAYSIEGNEAQNIVIATTRPETLLGDTAIIVHPDDPRYAHLIGKFAVVPIVGRPIPIIGDDYVDPEAGTGAMKCTPAHDFNDFIIGKRHNLPMISVMDETACINENAPEEYQGLERYAARKKLLAELEATEQLVEVEDYTTRLPYSQRSDVVIEPLLTDQWYVDAQTLAKPAIEAVEQGKTVFYPKQWENSYYAWMRSIEPWCISRQLWWGHQIPAWFGPDGEIFVAESEQEAQAQADAHYGKPTTIERDPDVLDTWFSSALWPFSTLGWPDKTPELDKYYPGDVLVTGFDILFFWVARMMMMGIHFMGEVPFKAVYMHALVRDSKGHKMSKSRGNVIDPLDMINNYGTDAIRFTLCAMAAQGRDIRLSEQRIEGYRNFATKIWNAARYLEMHNAKPDANFAPQNVSHALNRWIIGQTAMCKRAVDKAMHELKFNEAANALYDFVWGTYCDWYLELSKPLLEGDAGNEIRATSAWVFDEILHLLNPFMPYVTEELYANIATRDARLLESAWPEYDDSLINTQANAEIGLVQNIITEIRSVRSDMNVPPSALLHLQVRGADAANTKILNDNAAIIKRLARLETLSISDAEPPKGAIQSVLGALSLILPVADIIDLSKERARLEKELERAHSDLKRTQSKLANSDFVANAPDEVITEQRNREAESLTLIAKLNAALQAIAEAA